MRRCLLLALLLLPPALAGDDPKKLPREEWPLQKRINAAVDRAVTWVKGERGPDGLYRSRFGAAGATALALYALAASGVPASDPAISRSLKALLDLPVKKGTGAEVIAGPPALRMTYTHALTVLALATIDPAAHRDPIRRSVRLLVSTQKSSGQWAYHAVMGGPLDHGDNSNTQFALLALHVAARKGFPVPKAVWRRSYEHFRTTLRKDGGWGYGCPGSITGTYGSMTAVGVASLVIAKAGLLGEKKAAAYPYLKEREIARGLIWLEDHFAVDGHPGIDEVRFPGRKAAAPAAPPFSRRTFHFYWLYAVERVGMLLGERYIADHDWYREGAKWLVEHQDRDGSWSNPADLVGAPEPPLAATCFALLFLKKATLPVVTPRSGGEGRRRQAR